MPAMSEVVMTAAVRFLDPAATGPATRTGSGDTGWNVASHGDTGWN